MFISGRHPPPYKLNLYFFKMISESIQNLSLGPHSRCLVLVVKPVAVVPRYSILQRIVTKCVFNQSQVAVT